MPSEGHASSSATINELDEWRVMWKLVADRLLERLNAGDVAEFEKDFGPVARALAVCDPIGRQAASAALFGDFTRQAIAAGFDRTVLLLTFGMLRGDGFRSIADGQFVEFSPTFGSFNGIQGWGAYDAARLSEADGTEL